MFFNKITAETQLEWYKPEGILDDGMYEYKGKIKLEVEND